MKGRVIFCEEHPHQSEHKDLHDSLLVDAGDPYLPGLGCFLWMNPKPCLADEICEGETVCFSQIPMLGFQRHSALPDAWFLLFISLGKRERNSSLEEVGHSVSRSQGIVIEKSKALPRVLCKQPSLC